MGNQINEYQNPEKKYNIFEFLKKVKNESSIEKQ